MNRRPVSGKSASHRPCCVEQAYAVIPDADPVTIPLRKSASAATRGRLARCDGRTSQRSPRTQTYCGKSATNLPSRMAGAAPASGNCAVSPRLGCGGRPVGLACGRACRTRCRIGAAVASDRSHPGMSRRRLLHRWPAHRARRKRGRADPAGRGGGTGRCAHLRSVAQCGGALSPHHPLPQPNAGRDAQPESADGAHRANAGIAMVRRRGGV